MQVNVRTFTGDIITVNVDPSDTVYDLKTKIQVTERLAPDDQRLIFKGRQLENRRLLSAYFSSEGTRPGRAAKDAEKQSDELYEKMMLPAKSAIKRQSMSTDSKKRALEMILHQHQVLARENAKLCGLYSDFEGDNALDLTWSGLQPGDTVCLVQKLRGGMYHITSGRNGFEPAQPSEGDMETAQQSEDRKLQALMDSVERTVRKAAYWQSMAESYTKTRR
jgi:hypothetical protein